MHQAHMHPIAHATAKIAGLEQLIRALLPSNALYPKVVYSYDPESWDAMHAVMETVEQRMGVTDASVQTFAEGLLNSSGTHETVPSHLTPWEVLGTKNTAFLYSIEYIVAVVVATGETHIFKFNADLHAEFERLRATQHALWTVFERAKRSTN